MTPGVTAITIICLIVFIGSFFGFRASVGQKKALEEWSVAGRSFGLLLMWLLMAGELYTTFAFLGASGWAYSRGGPALYILAYITLGYVVSFYILAVDLETWQAVWIANSIGLLRASLRNQGTLAVGVSGRGGDLFVKIGFRLIRLHE